MSHNLRDAIDEVWQSTNAKTAAEQCANRLRASDLRQLTKLYDDLVGRVLARLPNATRELSPAVSSTQLLRLVAEAFHHSDSLAFLPLDLRRARIEELSHELNIPREIVHEAVSLGPSGLQDLM